MNNAPKRLDTQDVDTSNLQGGPDLDTVRNHEPAIVDEADGRVDNRPQDNPRLEDERPGAPFPTEPPDPSAEDPFVAGTLDIPNGFDDDIDRSTLDGAKTFELDEGPSYERDQGPKDDHTGGSTDPGNTRSHADNDQQ